MRWQVTKTLFTLWQAMMWGFEDDRRLFLRLLDQVVAHLSERANAQYQVAMKKREKSADR